MFREHVQGGWERDKLMLQQTQQPPLSNKSKLKRLENRVVVGTLERGCDHDVVI